MDERPIDDIFEEQWDYCEAFYRKYHHFAYVSLIEKFRLLGYTKYFRPGRQLMLLTISRSKIYRMSGSLPFIRFEIIDDNQLRASFYVNREESTIITAIDTFSPEFEQVIKKLLSHPIE